MKKLLSIILLTVILISTASCAGGGISFGKGEETTTERIVMTDPNLNADKKEIIPLTFCANIAQIEEDFEIPKGWYKTERGTKDFLDAYEDDPLYFTVPEEHSKSGYRGFCYMLIDDVHLLADVVETTGKYTFHDVYNTNILDEHFILAVERYSAAAMMNSTFYTVVFDADTKVLSITQDINMNREYSKGTDFLATALDLVPIDKSILKGVPLSEVTTNYVQAPLG